MRLFALVLILYSFFSFHGNAQTTNSKNSKSIISHPEWLNIGSGNQTTDKKIIKPNQNLLSPEDFLGYPLGYAYTRHSRIIEYFTYLSQNSKNIKLQTYGTTNEKRPLLVAFISSEENITKLEEIRRGNLSLAGLGEKAEGKIQTSRVLVWLSYNVHGNEPSSTEAAMQTLYELISKANTVYKSVLENTVIIIDPCLNPDGRERYINFYNQAKGSAPDPLPSSREHQEPWPGGRLNHYYYDLNRDWSWQTQKETIQRMALYNAWLPQVHVDYHEMGVNSPYYFSPASEPYHEVITPWQRQFQEIIGQGNAKVFEKNGWLYFNREEYDLLYPSYGDTYPTYNGSIGMTYEQAGGPDAGLAIRTEAGDTLTLKNRIDHHVATGLSTILTSSQHAKQLLENFKKYFSESESGAPGGYKSYILKFDKLEIAKREELERYLNRNGFEFGYSKVKKKELGFSYVNGKNQEFLIDNNDLILNAYQPKSRLLQSIFEPKTFLSDSVTYDITAWALPYAWGIPSFALNKSFDIERIDSIYLKKNISISNGHPNISFKSTENRNFKKWDSVYAYLIEWNGMPAVRALTALWKNGVKVRILDEPMSLEGHSYSEGTLIITRASNQSLKVELPSLMDQITNREGINLHTIASAFSKLSHGLASKKVRFLPKPEIGILYGDIMDPSGYGELWEYFDQEIKYPVHQIPLNEINEKSLKGLNTLIIPNVGKNANLKEESLNILQNWINNGGKIISIEGSLSFFAGKKGFNLKSRDPDTLSAFKKLKNAPANIKYGDRERKSLRDLVVGAIFKTEIDNTNPLAYGFPNYYFALKNKTEAYELFSKDKGWNVGIFNKNALMSGFCGDQARKLNINSLAFGWQEMGSGQVVYFADDPIYRSFWVNGKHLLANAIFMVGN